MNVRSAQRAAVVLLAVLTLTGCARYYYGKPGGGPAAFQADSLACSHDVGIPSGNKKYALVARAPFQRCMEAKGWTREKRLEGERGWYRGVEDDEVIDLEVGVVQPASTSGAGSLSRQNVCRQTYLQDHDWRRNLDKYRECLSR
jgi:hypothetical protein